MLVEVRTGHEKWKVMEFKHFIFQAWKVVELNCRFLKVMKIKALFDRSVTEDDKARTMLDKWEQLNWANGTHFGGHQS